MHAYACPNGQIKPLRVRTMSAQNGYFLQWMEIAPTSIISQIFKLTQVGLNLFEET